jgi:hypothetical protein
MLFFSIMTATLVGGITCMYRPFALLLPELWVLTVAASFSYMSIAGVFVVMTRKESSSTLLTLGYMFFVGIVVLLSRELSFFALIRERLPETYLFSFVSRIFEGDRIGLLEPEVLRYLSAVAAIVAIGHIVTLLRGIKAG